MTTCAGLACIPRGCGSNNNVHRQKVAPLHYCLRSAYIPARDVERFLLQLHFQRVATSLPRHRHAALSAASRVESSPTRAPSKETESSRVDEWTRVQLDPRGECKSLAHGSKTRLRSTTGRRPIAHAAMAPKRASPPAARPASVLGGARARTAVAARVSELAASAGELKLPPGAFASAFATAVLPRFSGDPVRRSCEGDVMTFIALGGGGAPRPWYRAQQVRFSACPRRRTPG